MDYTNSYIAYSVPELIRMFGSRIRKYRLRSGYTQKEVADMAGVSVVTIQRFESGTACNITFGTFLLVLKAVAGLDGIDTLLPDLPDSPYLRQRESHVPQRVRHGK